MNLQISTDSLFPTSSSFQNMQLELVYHAPFSCEHSMFDKKTKKLVLKRCVAQSFLPPLYRPYNTLSHIHSYSDSYIHPHIFTYSRTHSIYLTHIWVVFKKVRFFLSWYFHKFLPLNISVFLNANCFNVKSNHHTRSGIWPSYQIFILIITIVHTILSGWLK